VDLHGVTGALTPDRKLLRAAARLVCKLYTFSAFAQEQTPDPAAGALKLSVEEPINVGVINIAATRAQNTQDPYVKTDAGLEKRRIAITRERGKTAWNS
jgi:hypothetical protein